MMLLVILAVIWKNKKINVILFSFWICWVKNRFSIAW